jgi:hypothetical protein
VTQAITMIIVNSVTPKAAAKQELLLNKPASELPNLLVCRQRWTLDGEVEVVVDSDRVVLVLQGFRLIVLEVIAGGTQATLN